MTTTAQGGRKCSNKGGYLGDRKISSGQKGKKVKHIWFKRESVLIFSPNCVPGEIWVMELSILEKELSIIYVQLIIQLKIIRGGLVGYALASFFKGSQVQILSSANIFFDFYF